MADGYSQRTIASIIDVPRSTLGDWLREDVYNVTTEDVPDYSPKILLYDLETSPSLAWCFGRWKQNITQEKVEQETNILTYSAKWLGNPNIMSNRVETPEEDKGLVEELHMLFNQADLVVAHNGFKFDNGTVNARSVYHGLKPYSPVKFVDTLQLAKKNFRFPSNSLDSLAQYLGVGEKYKHSGFELWKRCMQNDQDAFEEMLEYNQKDVLLLEAVYLKLRAWDQKAPNLNVYFNDDVKRCPCCASAELEYVHKQSYTQQSAFDTYVCQECGKMSRSKKNLRSKDAMQNTIVNVMQ